MSSRVGVIVGSLRKGAYTRLMSRALAELAPQSLQLFDIEIGNLPLYNEDLETPTRRPNGRASGNRSRAPMRSCS